MIEHFRHIFASLLTKINFEMKNLSILLASAALVAFSFTSCKKDYNCDCTYTWTDGTTTDYSYPLLKMKKGDAETACTAYAVSDAYECTLNKQ